MQLDGYQLAAVKLSRRSMIADSVISCPTVYIALCRSPVPPQLLHFLYLVPSCTSQL